MKTSVNSLSLVQVRAATQREVKIEPNILNHVVSAIITGSEFSAGGNYQNVCHRGICCRDGKIVFRIAAEEIREKIWGGLCV
jgi:hypothetical protein